MGNRQKELMRTDKIRGSYYAKAELRAVSILYLLRRNSILRAHKKTAPKGGFKVLQKPLFSLNPIKSPA